MQIVSLGNHSFSSMTPIQSRSLLQEFRTSSLYPKCVPLFPLGRQLTHSTTLSLAQSLPTLRLDHSVVHWWCSPPHRLAAPQYCHNCNTHSLVTSPHPHSYSFVHSFSHIKMIFLLIVSSNGNREGFSNDPSAYTPSLV